ncbi:8-oxo-dGTP pyrophosphatase MutT (NUDIX family) [Polymorphobacter multimanifer]|uniref:8-oxo-dGTP pyrophosphatase MutT (NUDIX family) n=1 Tax=Polymorphobacter multimanifer TaxID=1070431 RepID=A0A841LEZ0_9SPHN|nr:CoA pyrophosphatase [Polymorphobacter multimanifer]MBB6227722.1 8-oxo-dGTP pyrophosphatase MutT (NUDIX family) [Polymorphobacter multimanifer]
MPIEALRAALLAGASADGFGGDHAVSGHPEEPPEIRGALARAAVLMAVTTEREPQLLLTRRQAHLKRHAGQIAFPGGRMDAGDASLVVTALREAEEEVALAREHVEVLGMLENYTTGTGFAVTPVVGLVPPGLLLHAHAGEVAEMFHVPLAHVLDPRNHELRMGEWLGKPRRTFVIRHGGREIWGATAGMIVNLSKRIRL